MGGEGLVGEGVGGEGLGGEGTKRRGNGRRVVRKSVLMFTTGARRLEGTGGRGQEGCRFCWTVGSHSFVDMLLSSMSILLRRCAVLLC